MVPDRAFMSVDLPLPGGPRSRVSLPVGGAQGRGNHDRGLVSFRTIARPFSKACIARERQLPGAGGGPVAAWSTAVYLFGLMTLDTPCRMGKGRRVSLIIRKERRMPCSSPQPRASRPVLAPVPLDSISFLVDTGFRSFCEIWFSPIGLVPGCHWSWEVLWRIHLSFLGQVAASRQEMPWCVTSSEGPLTTAMLRVKLRSVGSALVPR